MIRQNTAQKIAAAWHGGQHSAFYQFASSGTYQVENHLRYLQELEYCLNPEYWQAIPKELTKGDENELTKLKQYFISQGETNGIKTVWKKQPLYGYDVPYLDDDTPREITEKVFAISYPR